MTENKLILDNHLLVCIELDERFHIEEDLQTEYDSLKSNFCGRVICLQRKEDLNSLELTTRTTEGIVYVCGNIQSIYDHLKNSGNEALLQNVKVIREFSANVTGILDLDSNSVNLGQVPIKIHGVGVYYRNILDSSIIGSDNAKTYFDALQEKHKFQALTESNKPGASYRKGVYLSEVDADTDGSTLNFNLLRCSTNLDGPTLAFAKEDREILSKVNELAARDFEQKAKLNHVLAQVYENSVTVNSFNNRPKEHKAKIRTHSDKTKDMPANGLIVFCTFYSSDIANYKAPQHDRFDRFFKGASVLTQLRFKLKEEAYNLPLTKDFRVTLYPNSVFLIPLSTNRLYTHETCPPTLPVGKFPTRLGYVARCSKTKAIFKDNATFIQQHGKTDVRLEDPTTTGIEELKKLYQQENISIKTIVYKDINFSLNKGDYVRPIVD